ncbi:hypothetical protein J2T60_001900 [Natronospira proteinivora]|uniref:Glycosyltransferase 2-like domain-containing protein n=1 Tax=Natronospira proteinivora TaxID=1807133 RepID=A0ABT1GAG5_9GAMM|nr:glycosyltransferase family A protein [Natronospira proteinivora]MCP1727900.1 hypothetical protein [Natronospira proteinivora]
MSNLPDLVLVVVQDRPIVSVDRVSVSLRALRKRFNLGVMFSFSGPNAFFESDVGERLFSQDLIDRAYISDQRGQFMSDTLECARRENARRLVFLKLSDLENRWPFLIRDLIDFGKAGDPSGIVHGRVSVSVRTDDFRSDEDTRSAVSASPMLQGAAEDVSECPVLFVTDTGLKRFGGLSEFQSLPFLVGGLPVSEFKSILCLESGFKESSASQRDCPQENRRPGRLELADGGELIVDIQPISSSVKSCDQLDGPWSVPRMILSVRKLSRPLWSDASHGVTFAMSNHNKEEHLCSALYSVAMQTYPECKVVLIDDCSTDGSVDVAMKFKNMLVDHLFLTVRRNEQNIGTYRIRNSIISNEVKNDGVYLVNDSDDFSVSQRAAVQLSSLDIPRVEVTFGDIVRVDGDFRLLPLDGKADRYGTASLCAQADVHRIYGYYENLWKNADTEFIERVKHFGGRGSVWWERYPVLFQPFTGKNLTADIYDVTEGRITSDLSKRELHRELFRSRHRSLSLEQLPDVYPSEGQRMPKSYLAELNELVAEQGDQG